jgi:hypothetical protein
MTETEHVKRLIAERDELLLKIASIVDMRMPPHLKEQVERRLKR